MKIKQDLLAGTLATLVVGIFCLALTLAIPSGAEAGGFHFRGVRQNAGGGVSAYSRNVVRGPEGGYYKRSKGLFSDGSGNAVGWRSKSFVGPNGSEHYQSSGFTRSSDGSLHHKSYRYTDGAYGSGTSYGELTRSADGTISAEHHTDFTGKNGATYEASTTYDPASGLHHTKTITNAEGEVVQQW